ncbi:MAG: demethoxyubiquinone hydroxylase family protein [Marinicella sp.]
MRYKDSSGPIDTAKKILKVNHAGEFGAINIYRAQILVASVFMQDMKPLLQEFMEDETRHLNVFWDEIQARNGVKCKSYWLCGVGGYFMGFVSALFGRKGIMACTWAVESVVVNHLKQQLVYLKNNHDQNAYEAVNSILKDEENHRDISQDLDGRNIFLKPFRFLVSSFTEIIIKFGMR